VKGSVLASVFIGISILIDTINEILSLLTTGRCVLCRDGKFIFLSIQKMMAY